MTQEANSKNGFGRVIYWISTVLVAVLLAAIAMADLSHAPQILAGLAKLGYPPILSTILGVWQLLGVAAVLSPGRARLKEWAYAGFFFTLTGAAISHVSAHDSAAHILLPLVLLSLVITSYALRSWRRRFDR